jgi:hypothetical protein
MRRPTLFALLAVPAIAAGVLIAACSDEGEGEPCSLLNGSNDCQANLICEKPPGNSNSPAVCCPPDLSQATTPECSLPSGGVDASPAPPDVRTSETSTQDSPGEAQAEGGEAAADAPVEGASDAPTESAVEAGGDASPD